MGMVLDTAHMTVPRVKKGEINLPCGYRRARLMSVCSREQSQTALNFLPGTTVDGVTRIDPPLDIEAAQDVLGKFSCDCTYFHRAKRDLLANGWSESQIFGRAEIDVDTILLGFVDPQDTQTVPTWCSRTVNKILPATPLPVRLASTWVLTKLMRVSSAQIDRKSMTDPSCST